MTGLVVVLAVLMLGGASAAWAQATSNAAALIETLARGKDTGARIDAAKALAASRDPRAFDALSAALGDATRDVRWAAVEALGELGDRRAVAPLLEYLKKPEAYRFGKRLAVNALGAIADASTADALLGLLADDEVFVRRLAAMALLRLGDTRVHGRVTEAARNREDETMISVRRELARVADERAREAAAPPPPVAATPPPIRPREWSGLRVGTTPLAEVRARFGTPLQETPEFVLYPGDRLRAPLRTESVVINIDGRGVIESIFVFPAWGVVEGDLRALLGPGKTMPYAEYLAATGRSAQGAGTTVRGKLHYLPPDVPTESYAEMGMLVIYDSDASGGQRLVKLVIVH